MSGLDAAAQGRSDSRDDASPRPFERFALDVIGMLAGGRLSSRIEHRVRGHLELLCPDGAIESGPCSLIDQRLVALVSAGSGCVPGNSAAYAEWLIVERDDDDAACAVVAPLFAGLDPASVVPDLQLADAALIHVLSSAQDFDETMRVPWATYARDTYVRLRGLRDARTVHAFTILAQINESQAVRNPAFYANAAQAYQKSVALFELLSLAEEVEQARIRLAVCLHATGRCDEAIRHAAHGWQNWRTERRLYPAEGCDIAGPYTAMLRRCGRTCEANTVEAAARMLLPDGYQPGSSLFQSYLSEIGPDHDRVCRRGESVEAL